MITVYTLTYNEEFLIQFMINHYRERFPECHIVVYDNSSTDKTVEIAKNNSCEIRSYETGHQLNDGLHAQIKNMCWKGAETNWVLMCDLDELLDIDQEGLKLEESIGTTIIKPEGYDMVNFNDNYDFRNMTYGARHTGYDKCVLFNKKHITEINYTPGCHACSPVGNAKFNTNVYKLYHYKFIHPDLFIGKAQETIGRLSNDNRKYRWGWQCERTSQEWMDLFAEKKANAIKIR